MLITLVISRGTHDSMKARILVSLFALPFFGIGVWMLWSASSGLYDAWRMSDWVATNAVLDSAGYTVSRGDDSDTYEAYATYRYDYNFQTFAGDRVAIHSGGDNLGEFQRQLGRRLAAAQSRGDTVVIYVNPDRPDESIIDRSIRWGLTGFKSIFVVVFGGLGLGLLVAAWRTPRSKSALEAQTGNAPWLANDNWQSATIRSSSRSAMWAAWFFAILWNAISAVTPFLAYREVVQKENYIALIALLFPLVGIGLIAWAVRLTLEWRRFGLTPVTLDPFPGSIGGHVGGSVNVNIPHNASIPFVATLTCIKSYVSGSGDSRSRREKALWQDEVVAHTESGRHGAGLGTHVVFRFDVPEGQRPSDAAPDTDTYHLWRLNLRAELPGTDFDRNFEIPVYPTAEQSVSLSERELRGSEQSRAAARNKALSDIVEVSVDGIGKKLVYPMGRNALSNAAAILIGGSFAAAGAWLIVAEGATLFGGVFAATGGFIALFALYLLFRSLEVCKQGNTITSVRRWLGIPLRRSKMQASDFYRFEKDSNMKTQSGSKHSVYFRISAIDRDANEVLLGEGFRGESGAEAGIEFLANELGLARRGVSA